MRVPDVLSSLVDQGVIERVVRPLMSGKEAQIYLVIAGDTERVAKIYKEADNRTFKHRADYTEGRKVRNSRDQRAIGKRSEHGRAQDEAAWRSTEVDMIYRLRAAGVRVPAPYNFIDGVLIMELVTDANGEPAARLGEIDFEPDEAKAIYERLIQDVVRMLCAGVVHGDLSDFNVLLGADGPVIIDFPQAVDPSKNQQARRLLLRDVDNLHRFYTRFVPTGQRLPFAEEMWALYESNRLTPETRLAGRYRGSQKKADVTGLLDFIGEVNEDERRRRQALGQDTRSVPQKPRRVEIVVQPPSRGRRSGTAGAPAHRPPGAAQQTPRVAPQSPRAAPQSPRAAQQTPRAAPQTPGGAGPIDPASTQAPARKRRRRRRAPRQAAASNGTSAAHPEPSRANSPARSTEALGKDRLPLRRDS